MFALSYVAVDVVYHRGKFKYIFNGKVLKDDSTLAFYGIKHLCTIIKRIRLRGGGGI